MNKSKTILNVLILSIILWVATLLFYTDKISFKSLDNGSDIIEVINNHPQYDDGIYFGLAKEDSDYVNVKVSVHDRQIEDVQVLDYASEAEDAEKIIKHFPSLIVMANSPDIEGETLDSRPLIELIKASVRQALEQPAAIDQQVTPTTTAVTEDETTKVIEKTEETEETSNVEETSAESTSLEATNETNEITEEESSEEDDLATTIEPETTISNGKYTGKSKKDHHEVEVEVTLKDAQIKSIKFLNINSDQMAKNKTYQLISQSIINSNTTQLNLSQPTSLAEAIIEAVEDAINQSR